MLRQRAFLSFILICTTFAETPVFESQFIFDPEQAMEPHGHVHASCIVECPNGDLRAVWYENGRDLPATYFNEQQDKAANVRIGAARRQKGATVWEQPFVMSDTFGVSDNNPCMLVDQKGRLWLFYPTLLGSPGGHGAAVCCGLALRHVTTTLAARFGTNRTF